MHEYNFDSARAPEPVKSAVQILEVDGDIVGTIEFVETRAEALKVRAKAKDQSQFMIKPDS